jgi:DNA-binding transcriptional ArsR family regulator
VRVVGAVDVGVHLAVVGVLVVVVLDRSGAVVVAGVVGVGVGGAVGVGVLVLGVGAGHVCDYMRMHAGSEDLQVAAEIFRLLADPTRVALLHALTTGDELSVTALAERAGKRPTAVSQHLAKLRMGRLVTTRRQGTTVLYRLANDHVGRLVVDAVRHAEHLGPGVPAHHRDASG